MYLMRLTPFLLPNFQAQLLFLLMHQLLIDASFSISYRGLPSICYFQFVLTSSFSPCFFWFMFQLRCYTYDTAFWLMPSLLIQDFWPWNRSDVMFLILSSCYMLTFSSPFYYVYYRPALPLSIGLLRTYLLSRYLAAMSHYATSLTPSYSVQTFSHVHFILLHPYLWLPFIVLLTCHSLLPPHLWYFAYWRVTLLHTYMFILKYLHVCIIYDVSSLSYLYK